MIQIIILILFFNCIFTTLVTFEENVSNHENKGFIANGEVYDVEKYPFVVCLVIKVVRKKIKAKSLCTGSLISRLFVLTAAHCTVNVTASDINVFQRSHQRLYAIKNDRIFYEKFRNVYRYTAAIATNMSSAYINIICMIPKRFCQTSAC